ncbi:chromosome segregation protein [Lactobacillus colini]|uniref:Chromosome partition protein Smc n=1 Tax=Lactobacillus colini TaxID=1819254 RepID=A0ABS4MC87_9LACO|nr:chromosome segregation protein SMC [Lactobacillus colini]MBP2056956.1 chromosome segregation protein [Lactobacillus colini]
MPLQELIINGFKSFADKTIIKFDSGITGIVGPNGSGKSNITEAVRWVMGESSAKSLRGENMKDIIFAGSQFRTPMNHAEVTLIFDNHKHDLNLDSDQVAVTRKILRNGDSQYFINNKQVRLRDLRSLFVDAGMSQNSLAIISQGKVDQILNSRPQDRRSIFEEAAGVLHFKEQKQTALKQLEKTNDNLIRINDLVKELSDRVEPLAQQSSLAKQYKFQKAQLDKKMKQLLAIQIYQLNEQKEALETEAKKNSRILSKLDNEVKKSQTNLEEKRNQSELLHNRKDQAQKAVLELTQEVAALNTKIQMQEQTSKYDAATKKEYQAQKQELIGREEELKQQLKESNSDFEKTKTTLEKLKSELHSLNERLQEDPDQLNHALEQTRSDYIQTLQDQTSINNEIVYTQNEITKLKNSSNADELQLEDELNRSTKQLKDLKRDGSDLEDKREILNNKLSKLTDELENSQTAANRIKQTINNLITLLNRQTAQVEGLNRLKERHEGYYYGVKYVLNHAADFSGIIGVIGELISFSSKYQAAMTTALGAGVQDLVAIDRTSARNAIYKLKQSGGGRATFLPLDGLRYNPIPESTINTLKSIEGFLGVANQLITTKSKVDISNAINYLLGSVIVVDNMDTALQVQSKMGKFYRIVTLDGDVINPGGSMTGGARNQRTNSPLATNTEINKLNAAIKEEKLSLADNKKDYEAWTKKLADQQDRQAKLQASLQTISSKISELTMSYRSQEREVRRLEDLHQRQLLTKKQKANELEALKQKLVEQKSKKQELATKATKQKSKMDQIKQDLSNLDIAYNKVKGQVSDLKAKIAVAKNKLENSSNQKNQTQQQLQLTQDQINNLTTKINNINTDSTGNQDKSTLKSKIARLEANKSKRQAELSDINEELGKLDAQINNFESIASRNYDLRKGAAQQQEDYSVKKAQLSEKINHNLTQLSEDYSLTYEAALSLTNGKHDNDSLASLKKAVHLHKMSIEDIGPVNLKAIEEYDEVKQRYDFLNNQQNDLLKAREDIQKSMLKLDTEVEGRFGSTFNKIAKSFSEIFPIMFGGGHAKLVLTEPDNLLETGVKIVAQPPGKKLQNLSLLSGGERALTAITLLFAMLQVNPVPFCILDEVEAALDEANVVRFAKFLNRYEFATQFIVITHRRGTMQNVDNLYGVVMQESGVSQVLSVSLKELRKEVND